MDQDIIRAIEELSGCYPRWEVWSDFIAEYGSGVWMGHALACNNVFINDSIAVPPDGTIIHHMQSECQNKIETCGNAKITVK